METQMFMEFIQQLYNLKDNKAIALYSSRKEELSEVQRILILETFLIQCIQKIAGLEHEMGKKF